MTRLPALLLLAAVSGAAAAAVNADVLDRADVREFMAAMERDHGFAGDELQKIFGRVQISGSVLEAISRPAEALPWYKYRPIFVQSGRIELGVEFWKENRRALEEASKAYGVPEEILVAIIGVETRYGRNMGRYRVIDSLTTLAFDFPKRADFFRSELEHYLLLTREQGVDPLEIRGSYAGAMGIPQFISSSYRRYAVDFDLDGRIDLWDNRRDAIGSVGNYFREHGWRKGEAVAVRAALDRPPTPQVLTDGLEPDIAASDLSALGIRPHGAVPKDGKVKLLSFETEDGPEYWLGMPNFYVITRYNHSALYAMAVYQLAGEIRREFDNAVLASGR